jgi:hypothetical protein
MAKKTESLFLSSRKHVLPIDPICGVIIIAAKRYWPMFSAPFPFSSLAQEPHPVFGLK